MSDAIAGSQIILTRIRKRSTVLDVVEPSDLPGGSGVRIAPWSKEDHSLLAALLGDPRLIRHLGGPERPEKIAERQLGYERAGSRQFKIIEGSTGDAVGWVGYWELTWEEEEVFETGWLVLPAFQRRGLGSCATARIVAEAAAEGKRRFLHAFPSLDNVASNAICRALGFSLRGECDFEYPEGNPMRCNDWRIDLYLGATDRTDPGETAADRDG